MRPWTSDRRPSRLSARLNETRPRPPPTTVEGSLRGRFLSGPFPHHLPAMAKARPYRSTTQRTPITQGTPITQRAPSNSSTACCETGQEDGRDIRTVALRGGRRTAAMEYPAPKRPGTGQSTPEGVSCVGIPASLSVRSCPCVPKASRIRRRAKMAPPPRSSRASSEGVLEPVRSGFPFQRIEDPLPVLPGDSSKHSKHRPSEFLSKTLCSATKNRPLNA
jgi:hypothetical protein